MRARLLFAIYLAVICLPAVGLADPGYLCRDDEELIFGCRIDKKMVSICGSRNFTATTGYVQYRFGTPDKLELEYPASPSPARDHFRGSHAVFSGGFETRVRFENSGVLYMVYTAMYRTRYDGGPNEPNMPSGVSVRIKGKPRVDNVCTDDAHFPADTHRRLDQEKFDYSFNMASASDASQVIRVSSVRDDP